VSINNLKFVTSLDYFYVYTFFKNMYFCSQKLRFEHYFVYCKMTMASLKQFIICSNLFSKLEKNCFKEAIFILLAVRKKILQKQFFGAKIHIFEKRSSFRSQIFYDKPFQTVCVSPKFFYSIAVFIYETNDVQFIF